MKIHCKKSLALALLSWVFGMLSVMAQSSVREPIITGIRTEGSVLLVTVQVPEDCRRLTLESRPRLGHGSWIPRHDHWVDGETSEVTLSIPVAADIELLRVKGETEADLPLPSAFYLGSRFSPPASQTNSTPPTPAIDGGGLGPINNGNDVLTGAPGADRSGAEAGGRTVAESDIWQIEGSTLYFFNSVRGLQVIDLSNPDVPLLTGTLGFEAHGEQMYLLPEKAAGERWLALLTTSACDWNAGEVILVRVTKGIPTLGSRIPFNGQIRESRRVGSVLYLATYRWREMGPGQAWQSETGIISIDLADPTSPRRVGELILAANPDAIQATDTHLMVATTGPATGPDNPLDPLWLRPGVHSISLFDISDPAGEIVPKGSVRVKGRVQDKFKMHLHEKVLTVVSWRSPEWRVVTRTNWYIREFGPNGERLVPAVREAYVYNTYQQVTPNQTWLETYDIADASQPSRLGELKIIEDETLFATRFVADRAYVVTFQIVDPFWIIDLSNPALPVIRGELEIPGYSSHLEPIGTGRLLAVGVEGGNATVALFDVSDDERPTQLSKVFLGTGWSWSEANHDEKAFRYIPELGLILIPWQGWQDNTHVQAVQLVDLDGDRLIPRGVIQHQFQPRRATALNGRIVSISGQELLVVDAADRDQPEVTADLDLSFNVSRVVVDGDSLITLSAPWGKTPRIRRSSIATPEVELGLLDLPNFPVVGFAWINAQLHLIQHEPDTYRQDPHITLLPRIQWFPVPQTNWVARTNWVHVTVPGQLVARVVGFDGHTPKLLGESRVTRPDNYHGNSFEAHPSDNGLVIWTESLGGGGWDFGRPPILIGSPVIGGISTDAFWGGGRGWWWWQNTLTVLATTTTPSGVPAIQSLVQLGGTPRHQGFSDAWIADRRLYVSHREYLTREEKRDPDAPVNDGFDHADLTATWWITETRHSLNVVDFTDPMVPAFRALLDLPGELGGISHGGALLYATAASTNSTGRSSLQALAYDGLGVSLVDTREIAPSMPIRVLIDGRVLVNEPGTTNSPARLEAWKLGNDGRWNQSSSIIVPGEYPVTRLIGDLVLVEGSSTVRFLRPTADGFTVLGDAVGSCGYWGDWGLGDVGADATLWLPSGDYGLKTFRPMVVEKP